jgi:hypothetical protein
MISKWKVVIAEIVTHPPGAFSKLDCQISFVHVLFDFQMKCYRKLILTQFQYTAALFCFFFFFFFDKQQQANFQRD